MRNGGDAASEPTIEKLEFEDTDHRTDSFQLAELAERGYESGERLREWLEATRVVRDCENEETTKSTGGHENVFYGRSQPRRRV
ncbi:hypothetical protein C440_02148 [Haloferax mucosum ATCC BAA-1512]|uniref:Uncharacterized protein n=1 Tax=Haloferax mucosum ATCC BAA-1512 TaxID=662479 RepID=M0IMK1_9EURY|nr:hypothetical protein C440_02148 [Haloferax mucosum ATCC BAA-1512]